MQYQVCCCCAALGVLMLCCCAASGVLMLLVTCCASRPQSGSLLSHVDIEIKYGGRAGPRPPQRRARMQNGKI